MRDNLIALQANPDRTQPNARLVARIQAQIEKYGLTAYFQAVGETMPADAGVETQRDLSIATTIPREGSTQLTWWDCIRARQAQPLRTFRPTSLPELREIVTQAATQKLTVKAVGSGHSFADVAITPDYLVDTHGLNKPLDLDVQVLRSVPHADADTANLVEIECGITVHELNDWLWEQRGKALINMGGYDGQTVLGVVSTATHGSGVQFGPLADFVKSITLVAGDGTVYRIEPSNGITDANKWRMRHPDIVLKQDDAWFDAVRVGIGCMGVVYSVIVAVRNKFMLKEERTLSTWSQIKQDLRTREVLSANSHYEILVNPYKTDRDYTCLVTRRNATTEPPSPTQKRRNFWVELIAQLPLLNKVLVDILNRVPELTPSIINKGLAALAGTYIDRSYRVFNIGHANDVRAYGSEIGVPLTQVIAATERILSIAEQRARVGRAYLSSPFSLRFVNASSAYLAMMHNTPTCMIEFPMLEGTYGGRELLREIEHALYALGGRPHWGLLNFVQGRALVEAMYPLFGAWNAVRKQLDPDNIFRNAFTERCGVTQPQFMRTNLF